LPGASFEVWRGTKTQRVTAYLSWARPLEGKIMIFDYSLPAELYLAKRGGGQRKRLQYRCFPTAAEAIRFAVEEFPSVATLGAWMQVGRARFDSQDIRSLYDGSGYPLRRRTS
jgi:hypothetical protein